MDVKDFFINLEIKKDDIEKAKYYIKAKGLFYHLQIKKKLFAWTEGDTIKYSQIVSYYRYDKRIRMVLYKYIAYIEEYYRATILDAYYENTTQNFWISDITVKLNEDFPLNVILESLSFNDLIKQIKKMPLKIQQECNLIDKNYTNVSALKTLRNAVMHNKFLLMYRNFGSCCFDNKKSSSLSSNILNLISFLPHEVGQKCREDINKCTENRNTDQDTEWDLPEQAIISLN